MEDKDFIFEEEKSELEQPFDINTKILVNGEEFTLTKFIKSKTIGDKLGFPVLYSWYEAKDERGETTNIFFFDDDIDSIEKNSQISSKWFEEYGGE